MTLSESIEAATSIVDRYPNGGKSAGKSYLGALAATLANYPRQVALACADLKGVSAECEFLPTVASIVAWCEKHTEPLRSRYDHEQRRRQQFNARDDFESEQGDRPRRLSVGELKEKYGDWQDNWRSPGTKARELCEQARKRLVEEIGELEFRCLPEATK